MRGISLNICLACLLLMANGVHAQHFESYTFPNGTFEIDWRDKFSAEQKQKVRDWLYHMNHAVASLHGEWPRQRIRVALEKYNSSSAVVFGRVLRNRPQGVLFYVNPERPLEEFVASWTPYHEFAHLFIPYPGRADIWFSEGLASYYQNILRVRAGQLTTEEALNAFAAAFQRGRDDDAHSDLTLGELSADMRNRRAFMRVYWSGAMYFMEADLALRALPEPTTLDEVLHAYNRCCLPDSEIRPGRQLAAEFDRLADAAIFAALYDKYEGSNAIPAWQTLLEKARGAGILSVPQQEHAVESANSE